jgi:hypothetical protein
MRTTTTLATVALAALVAAPLSAQVVLGGGTVHDRVEDARRRTEEARARARIDSGFLRSGRSERGSSRVPPGHLPPRGLCRVWIDGVPPGQQPPVTDCTTAERTRTVNSRVIYGDRESFPGKGKGKFKNGDVARSTRDCSIWDRVIVDGRTVPVCREDQVERERRRQGGWYGDDDDRFEDDDSDRSARGKSKLAKAERKAANGAKKGKRGRG